ncbi:hypothetical protein IMZ48_47760 [Candidatus Bathyarchaeota archaeon]|nr:hypothetical protein [Candidatus Bathyarchaeota archaeon]
MMASVVVERYGVPPDRVVQASNARYTGALVSMMFGGYAMKRHFRIMIPLQMACAIASQFSSTLLFSDLGYISITGFPREMEMSYDFGPFNESEYTYTSPLYNAQYNYATAWSSDQPMAFETFAEYAEPESRILADGVDDTGPIWRAFLSIGNESLRTSVREYTGVARVFDARTICVRPDIKGLSFAYSDSEVLDRVWTGRATVNTSQIPNVFDRDNVASEITFFCQHHPATSSHQWVQCSLDTEILPSYDLYTPNPHRIPSLDPLAYNTSAPGLLDAEERRDRGIEPWDKPPRIRMHERRTGDGYILMDLGSEYASDIYGKGPFFFKQELTNATDTTIPSDATDVPPSTMWATPDGPWPLTLLSSTASGPWTDIETKFLPNQMDDGAEQPMSFRATYCMDVVM